MNNILDPIISSARFPIYLKQLQEIAQTESMERLRFYNQITEQQKAEFINGKILIHSPVKRYHSIASDNLFALMKYYVTLKNLGEVRHEKALIKLTRNDFEPDICFFKTEQSKNFTPKQLFFPPPDMVVEVLSKHTETNDRGVKFEDYALHKVAEYWIVDPELQIVEQYILQDEAYILHLKSNNGDITSTQIDGFKINIRSIFDEAENLKTLQTLLYNNCNY